jgi:hypothetical protein
MKQYRPLINFCAGEPTLNQLNEDEPTQADFVKCNLLHMRNRHVVMARNFKYTVFLIGTIVPGNLVSP